MEMNLRLFSFPKWRFTDPALRRAALNSGELGLRLLWTLNGLFTEV
jgi:hypothetical protein